MAVITATEINTLQTTGVDANGERGTDLFDAAVTTTGAAGFTLLQSDPLKVAAAGLLKITGGALNSGGATLNHGDIAAGVATPAFTINFAADTGYEINGAAVAVDANGDFTFEGINYTFTGTPEDGDSFTVGLNASALGDNRNMPVSYTHLTLPTT